MSSSPCTLQKLPPVIILVRPQLAENAGAVARAMANFGLKSLRLVSPCFSLLDPKAIALAAGADSILENATVHTSLADAVKDLRSIYGTSASERDMVKNYYPVREAMAEIVNCEHTGIVFGPERTGLTNEEMVIFRKILHIPVNPAFASLNLSKAVAITAYEWHQTQTRMVGKLHVGASVIASQKQLQGFLTMLEHHLDKVHFWRINHKKPIMWRNLQNIFTRMDLTEQEIRTLHGMLKALTKESDKN